MSSTTANGVRLYYELTGSGDIPLVLVHGAWVSHRSWERVVPGLGESFRVLSYDRRGHSDSEPGEGRDGIHVDVADAAALIEELDLVPAWIAGISAGASIALRVAAERPELLRGVIAHEPALFSLLEDDPATAVFLSTVRQRMHAVVERIAAGDHAGAAEEFAETVALGPGGWEQMPADYREVWIDNAPTFVADAADADTISFDLDSIRGFSRPVLLTRGEQSPSSFAAVLDKLAEAMPRAEVRTFPGAGHVPQRTQPDAYVEAVTRFILENDA